MEDLKGIEEIKARLMILPENTSGILFLNNGNVRRESLFGGSWLEDLKRKNVKIQVVCCVDVEGIKLINL